jgi:hypothetical protein
VLDEAHNTEAIAQNLFRIAMLLELKELRDRAEIQMGKYHQAMAPLQGLTIKPDVKERVKAELIDILDNVAVLIERTAKIEVKLWGVSTSELGVKNYAEEINAL